MLALQSNHLSSRRYNDSTKATQLRQVMLRQEPSTSDSKSMKLCHFSCLESDGDSKWQKVREENWTYANSPLGSYLGPRWSWGRRRAREEGISSSAGPFWPWSDRLWLEVCAMQGWDVRTSHSNQNIKMHWWGLRWGAGSTSLVVQ